MSEYPSEEELKEIESWPNFDIKSWMETCESLWSYPERWETKKIKEDGEDYIFVKVSTGGWSGNESIISSMQQNFIMWSQTWECSKRGGYYEFKFKDREYKEEKSTKRKNAKNLQDIREQLNLTAKSVAEELDIDLHEYIKMENGEKEIDFIKERETISIFGKKIIFALLQNEMKLQCKNCSKTSFRIIQQEETDGNN